MTKEEKQRRKHLRCEKRRERKGNYNVIGQYMRKGLSVSQAKSAYRWGYFYNDYGEQMQVCDYQGGFCTYPCNGDC